MYRISDQQIDYILSDIGARGVEMESLQQNLVDHVCCIIENNLEENGDFESFYKQTIQTFYKDALWEIEEETLLLLTYKNYYTMKKVMIISGIFSATIMSFGILFKFMHWPGAGLLLLVSMITISLIFLPLLFILKIKETNEAKNRILITTGTLFGILFSLSSLFKIMHWPGANIMLLIALGILLMLFIPLYFILGIRNPETKTNTIVTTIILIAAGGMLFALTNIKPNARYLSSYEIKMFNEDDRYIEAQIDSLNRLSIDSLNKKYINNVNQIYTICNEVKSYLLLNEFGFEKFPNNTNQEGLLFSTATFNDYADRSSFCKEKFNALGKITLSHFIDYIGCEYKLNKGRRIKRHPSFQSTITHYHADMLYYNNNVIGAYKDLQELQLKYIYETCDLIKCKKGNSN